MSLIPKDNIFDFDRAFGDMFRHFPSTQANDGFFAPRVDIKEKDDAYMIEAELPGADKDALHLTLHNGNLSIEGSIEDESKEEKDGKVIRRERRYGKFSRSFYVGEVITEDDISANFADGVLKVTVPKKAPTPPEKKRIEVS